MLATATANTTIIAAIYGAFARGDLDAVLSAMHPDLDWITPASLPWSRGRYRGHDGIGEYFRAFLGTLADASVEPDELIDAGDRVVAIGCERARGAAGGRAFQARFVHIWTLRDGRVTQMEGVVDTAAIVAALGAPVG